MICCEGGVVLTFNRALTFRFAAAAENKLSWVHGGKVLHSLEAQASVCPDDDDCLSSEIVPYDRGHGRKLIDEEREKGFLHREDEKMNRVNEPMGRLIYCVGG